MLETEQQVLVLAALPGVDVAQVEAVIQNGTKAFGYIHLPSFYGGKGSPRTSSASTTKLSWPASSGMRSVTTCSAIRSSGCATSARVQPLGSCWGLRSEAWD